MHILICLISNRQYYIWYICFTFSGCWWSVLSFPLWKLFCSFVFSLRPLWFCLLRPFIRQQYTQKQYQCFFCNILINILCVRACVCICKYKFTIFIIGSWYCLFLLIFISMHMLKSSCNLMCDSLIPYGTEIHT